MGVHRTSTLSPKKAWNMDTEEEKRPRTPRAESVSLTRNVSKERVRTPREVLAVLGKQGAFGGWEASQAE